MIATSYYTNICLSECPDKVVGGQGMAAMPTVQVFQHEDCHDTLILNLFAVSACCTIKTHVDSKRMGNGHHYLTVA